MLRTWGGSITYVVIGIVVAFWAVGWIPSWPSGRDVPASGESRCIDGQLFHIVGTDEDHWIVDGFAYGPGDAVLLGACGPDGKRIR